jgi:NAD(P)-dependent dehydrogenase (short-subunit alcohol dehydrogenase family)
MKRLEKRVAIVTGGARGLGKAVCSAMAEQGAKIVVADVLEDKARETADEIVHNGGAAIPLRVNVTSEKETLQMAEETFKTFGRIDILVNNAALLGGGRRPFFDVSSAEWDDLIAVNLRGPFLCSKAVFPCMRRQGRGKIINIASETAFTGSKGFIHYVTSKGGIISFTRSLASEAGPYGICVNAVAPGFLDTESSKSLIDDISKYDTSLTPLGRMEKPEDVVGAVVFLCSEESDFITGQTMVVDGGRYKH